MVAQVASHAASACTRPTSASMAAGAIERLALPRRAEVAPAGERPARPPQPLDGIAVVERRAAAARVAALPDGASSAWARASRRTRGDRAPRPPPPAAPRSRGSTRASTGRSCSRSLQNPWIVLTRASSRWAMASSSRARRVLPGAARTPLFLQPRAQPQLQLARRLLGERQRRDRLHGPPPLGEHIHQARDQLARLAGARRRLDDQRLVERRADALALGRVDQPAHGELPQRVERIQSGGWSLSVRRVSSSGPHTSRKSQIVHARWRGAAGQEAASIARSISSSTSGPRRAPRRPSARRARRTRRSACSSRGATRTTLAADQICSTASP